MYGDTRRIRALARAMRQRADAIRIDADGLAAHAQAAPWQGLAADAMRRTARDHAGRLRTCADAHHRAADALDRHAHAVDHVKEVLRSAEHRARELAELGLSIGLHLA
jgi:predicted TIM-barrel enzyme